MTSVVVGANPPTRKSRLFKNMWQHIIKSGGAILKGYFMYEPWKLFVVPGSAMILVAMMPFLRYIILVLKDDSSGHLQSLVAGAVLFITGFLFIGLGIIADLIKTNRILLEQSLQIEKERLYYNQKNN